MNFAAGTRKRWQQPKASGNFERPSMKSRSAGTWIRFWDSWCKKSIPTSLHINTHYNIYICIHICIHMYIYIKLKLYDIICNLHHMTGMHRPFGGQQKVGHWIIPCMASIILSHARPGGRPLTAAALGRMAPRNVEKQCLEPGCKWDWLFLRL